MMLLMKHMGDISERRAPLLLAMEGRWPKGRVRR